MNLKLSSILKEVVDKKVDEIADTATKPYSYELITRSDKYGSYTYSFYTGAEDEYEVDLTYRSDDGSISVSFDANNSPNLTNKPKELFKVMATIMSIVKEVISNLKRTGKKVKFIEFDASGTKSGTRNIRKGIEQREKLYYKYIKSTFPNAKAIKPNYIQIAESNRSCECGCQGSCSI